MSRLQAASPFGVVFARTVKHRTGQMSLLLVNKRLSRKTVRNIPDGFFVIQLSSNTEQSFHPSHPQLNNGAYLAAAHIQDGSCS